MPTPPSTQHCSISLWRGYVAAQFYVRGEDGEALAVSQPFRTWRFPWQEEKALEDDPNACAALTALEAELLAHGWDRVQPPLGAAWYELRFRRVNPTESPSKLLLLSQPDQLAPLPRLPVASANGDAASVTVETFEAGCRAALDRFTAAVDRSYPPEHTSLPLFEALNWAVSLVDGLGYPDVSSVRGLRWARNAVHSHWAKALGRSNGPAVAPDWFWLPVERMPKPRASKQEPEQREAYVARFAGQRAQEPLRRLLEELAPYLPPAAGTTQR